MKKSIDNVTTITLSAALRVLRMDVDEETCDKIIDVVELLEEKGDNVTMSDLKDLSKQWFQSSQYDLFSKNLIFDTITKDKSDNNSITIDKLIEKYGIVTLDELLSGFDNFMKNEPKFPKDRT